MSSISSYATEMVSISSGNTAAETEINIDEGYATINDTGLQRKRRLPMPPALKPPRPKKNTLCHQRCKELCSYCVDSRLILTITLLVLTLAALGVLIYLLVTKYVPEPTATTTVLPTAETGDDGVPEGSNGTLKFVMSPVQNPEIMNLLQESLGRNITILQNVKLNFTNRTWSFDGRDISINISMVDKIYFHIVLNMEITNSQCRHAGKYFVLLSGNNHKAEQSRLYNVKAGCPCESGYELNSGTELKCELKVIGNTTINFEKVSGENIKSILYQTGIRIPDNVRGSGIFSAMWSRSGTLTTRIKFSPVRCPDEGNYSLTVTSRKGTRRHYIYVKVIDHPNEPTISTLRGLIKGKENVLQCQASTGCKNASLILQTTESKGNYYIPWDGNITSIHFQEGYIWKTNATLILTSYMVDIGLNKRCLRCTYSIGDKPYYSKPICIKSIEADFCETRKFDCQYTHPYDCNKFITCTKSGPVESFCQAGLHYHQKVDNCTGECRNPYEVNCKIRLFDGCDCQVN